MDNEILILGATGRTGREVAARLAKAGIPLVLAGRSRERLQALADELGGRILAGTLEQNLAALAADVPAVVVNTVGPFAETAATVARALPAGTHYVDLSNEFSGTRDILDRDDQAKQKGQTLVSGAGFGVLGTESVVLKLCAGRPRPSRVRVDAVASVALEDGTVGAALAGSIVEVLRFGGREVRGGSMVKAPTASHSLTLTTPDGDVMTTGSGANGELLAAWRASGADSVIAASTAVPTSALLRNVALPLLSALIRIPGAVGFLTRRVAAIRLKATPMSRRSSWGHASVEWASGESAEGWLRAGDGSNFTADVMAKVALRLLRGEGRPGAFTPGALFGSELAESVGGTFSLSLSSSLDDN